MKRPMIFLAAVWLSGLLLGRHLPGSLVICLCSYFFWILFVLIYLRWYPAALFPYVRKERYGALTIFLLCVPLLFCGGFFRQQAYEQSVKKDLNVWQRLEKENVTQIFLTGTVTGKTVEGEQTVLTLSDCMVNTEESGITEGMEVPGTDVGMENGKWQAAGGCRVTIKGEGSKWLPESRIGNRIRVYGTFYLYEAAGNPGQFDAASYYHGKGIFSSVKALRVDVLSEKVSVLGQGMFLLKQKMRETLSLLYPEEKAGVLVAMLLGDKDILPNAIKELYQQNGISHILAISGLHISMICMGLFRLLRRLRIPLRMAAVLAIVFLGFYVVFSGAGTSSLRAGIMCLVLLTAKLSRRSYDLLSSLSFAAILVTLLRPQELTSAGFLLSFGAVVGVAVAQEMERESAGSSLLFGGMIQLVTLPISLWFYYELAPYSVLLNLVIIPLAAFVLGGGIASLLVGMFLPKIGGFFAGGTYLLLSFYEWLGEITQNLPYSFVLVGRPEVWQMAVYYAGIAVMVCFFKKAKEKEATEIAAGGTETGGINGRNAPWRKKRLHVKRSVLFAMGILVCPGILFLPKAPVFSLMFLDVSQGDGILLTTEKGEVLLFDGGSTDVSGVGEYRISPLLKQQGIALLDTVSVSHMDSDHYSGVLELLIEMPVYEGRAAYLRDYEGDVGIRELVLPEVEEPSEEYLELVTLCAEKNVAVRYMEAGEVLYREEEILIECLAPVNAKKSENDTSLVFLLQTPELAVWLMGDAGVAAEEELVERLGENVRSALAEKFCILKVGHHGSKTSSGDKFVSYVRPDICVISCGYKNSYGHPHAEVVRRLLGYGCEIYRTDLQGCVIVKNGMLRTVFCQEE